MHAMPPAGEAETPTNEPSWQPLPPRSRPLFLLGAVIALAIAGAVAGSMLGLVSGAFIAFAAVGLSEITGWHGFLGGTTVIAGVAVLATAGALFGLWLGAKQYRHTAWRLDAQGLALRRGRLWQRETRVPASRVQHLDIKRGPLQRGRELSTLVVHTAGTRHSSVTVPNLDAADAERLRDRLGRALDQADD